MDVNQAKAEWKRRAVDPAYKFALVNDVWCIAEFQGRMDESYIDCGQTSRTVEDVLYVRFRMITSNRFCPLFS